MATAENESRASGLSADHLMATEPHCSNDEKKQSIASLPTYLSRQAVAALDDDGALVQVYLSDSRIVLLRGSKDYRPLPSPIDVSSAPSGGPDSDYIFSTINPDYHLLYLQQPARTRIAPGPSEAEVQYIKEYIAGQVRRVSFGGTSAVNRKQQKQQQQHNEDPSFEQPDEIVIQPEPVYPILTVIKTANRNLSFGLKKEVAKTSINKLMELAREKDECCPLGVLFGEWKLSATTTLSALPLVPSLSNNLPWFYMANPWMSQGDNIFGNITTCQSFLVANSDLQSGSRLMYSKDGWLLFQRKEGAPSRNTLFSKCWVFLFNPTTGARMDLPSLHFEGVFAAISMTTQGTPGVIIYVRHIGERVLVYMARPGSTYWEEHPYVFKPCRYGTMEKMVLCDGSLYCLLLYIPAFRRQ